MVRDTPIILAAAVLATVVAVPAAAGAACPVEPPPPPEVVVIEVPAPPPPVVRVPLRMSETADDDARFQNVFAAPMIVEPEFRATLVAASESPAGPPCWRVARVEVRLGVAAAQLQVPREFAGSDCLDRGAVAAARAAYAGTVAGVREFLERARPAVARHSTAFGWTRAGGEAAALDAYDAWLRPRISELWEASKAEAGGEPRLPGEAVFLDAARQACPDFVNELHRFREEELRRRSLGGRPPI